MLKRMVSALQIRLLSRGSRRRKGGGGRKPALLVLSGKDASVSLQSKAQGDLLCVPAEDSRHGETCWDISEHVSQKY